MSTDGSPTDRDFSPGTSLVQAENTPRKILISICCVMAFGAAVRWTVFRNSFEEESRAADYHNSQENSVPTPGKQQGASSSAVKDGNTDPNDLQSATSYASGGSLENVKDMDATRARSLAGALRVKARSELVEKKLDDLSASIQNWSSRVTPFFENEHGRRIAGSPEHLERFLHIPHTSPIPATQVIHWKQAFNILMTPVNNALENKTDAFQSVDEHIAELETLAVEIDKAAAVLKSDLSEAARIARETISLAAGDLTLAQAIQQIQEEQRTADREKIAAASQAAHRQAMAKAKRLAEAAAQAIVVADNKVLLRNQEKEKLKRLAAAEILRQENDERAKKLAQKQLIAEFKKDAPEMNNVLRAFMTPALMQIGDRGFHRSGNPVRMSYGRIQGFGALENSDVGLKRLHNLGGSTESWRPNRGSFPAYNEGLILRDKNVRKRVLRAQVLLAKYGELLVKHGHLRP